MDHQYKLSVLLNNKSNSMKVFENINNDRQNRHQNQWKGKVNVFLEHSESIHSSRQGRSFTNETCLKIDSVEVCINVIHEGLKYEA